jgi:hypothetical protein
MIPGVLMMLGAGLAATPIAALATSGAAPEEAGLLSGLINTSRTMGGSLGLAAMSTVAAGHAHGATTPEALTDGYAAAFRISTVVLLGGAVLMAVWLPGKARPGKIPAGQCEGSAAEQGAEGLAGRPVE